MQGTTQLEGICPLTVLNKHYVWEEVSSHIFTVNLLMLCLWLLGIKIQCCIKSGLNYACFNPSHLSINVFNCNFSSGVQTCHLLAYLPYLCQVTCSVPRWQRNGPALLCHWLAYLNVLFLIQPISLLKLLNQEQTNERTAKKREKNNSPLFHISDH